MPNKIEVERSKKNVCKLKITVPAETVDEHFSQKYRFVQKKAKVKGFREGHVPLSMVKKIYRKDVESDVLNAVLNDSYSQAIEEKKLRVVSRPSIQPEPGSEEKHEGHSHPKVYEGQDFSYTATVELFPEFEVSSYRGLSVKRDKVKIADKEVESVIENMRNSRSQMIPLLEERPAKKGDFADIHFDGGLVTPEGVEKQDGMKGDQVLEIGSNQFIPGFEDQLVGMKRGETKTFRIQFPKDYGSKDHAGKDAEFIVKLNEIKQKKVPEFNDDFAKELNFDSVSDLKNKTKENLTKYKDQEADQKLRNDLLEELVKKNKFDLPESMVQAQSKMIAQDLVQNMKSQGYDPQMAQNALVSEQENIKKKAERQVRAGLLLDAIASKEKIEVSEKDVEKEMEKMAQASGTEMEQIKKYYSESENRENLEFRIKENLTIQFLLENAKVK